LAPPGRLTHGPPASGRPSSARRSVPPFPSPTSKTVAPIRETMARSLFMISSAWISLSRTGRGQRPSSTLQTTRTIRAPSSHQLLRRRLVASKRSSFGFSSFTRIVGPRSILGMTGVMAAQPNISDDYFKSKRAAFRIRCCRAHQRQVGARLPRLRERRQR